MHTRLLTLAAAAALPLFAGCAATGMSQAARLAAGRFDATAATFEPEHEVRWESPEGQVANFGCWLITLLTFWLLIPLLWAGYRYLRTASHRYELTDQRFLEHSGIVVKRMESLELYRVIDIQVSGTLIQSLFGRGRVLLTSSDHSTPHVTINAIASPAKVANRIRDAVERCRVAKGVRAVDF